MDLFEETRSLFERHFGNIFEGHGQAGNRFVAHFPTKYRLLNGSEYFYEGAMEFVHFTSLPVLFSILNSRSIRLYDLHNSADVSELSNGMQLLKFTEGEMDRLKRHSFSFSFCAVSELHNDDLWVNYGNNYEGVAIVFEIDSQVENWRNYHLSKVKYGDAHLEKIRQFQVERERLEKDFPVKIMGNFGTLLGFHKREEYSHELEVRLFTHFPYQYTYEYDSFTFPEYRINDNRNRLVRYLELPLWVDNESVYIKSRSAWVKTDLGQRDQRFDKGEIPKIKLKKILVGHRCGMSSIEYGKLYRILERQIKFNLGYEIDVPQKLFTPEK